MLPLAGFRSDSRELLCSIRGLVGRPVESRVSMRDLRTEADETVRGLLRDADLVILATGYRPSALALYDESGAAIRLGGAHGPGRLVDASSRVLDTDGWPVPGVFATGLSSGFPLAGRYGEPSFTGQANGLSLWQTDIGAQIATAVCAGSFAEPSSARSVPERSVHRVA